MFEFKKICLLSISLVYMDFQFGKLCTPKRKSAASARSGAFTPRVGPQWNTCRPKQDKVLITSQSAFLCLTWTRPWGPCLYMAGVSVCSQCRPKFLPNASGGRNGVGVGVRVGVGGGAAGTAALPPAAVRKPHKSDTPSKRSLWAGPAGSIEITNLCSGPSRCLPPLCSVTAVDPN